MRRQRRAAASSCVPMLHLIPAVSVCPRRSTTTAPAPEAAQRKRSSTVVAPASSVGTAVMENQVMPGAAAGCAQRRRAKGPWRSESSAACALVIVDGSPITVSGAMAEVTAFFFGRSRPEPS